MNAITRFLMKCILNGFPHDFESYFLSISIVKILFNFIISFNDKRQYNVDEFIRF